MNPAADIEQLRSTLRFVLPVLPKLASILDRADRPRGAAQARELEAAVSGALAGTWHPTVSIDPLLHWVSFEMGVPVSIIQTDCRRTGTVRARSAVMWGARRLLSLTYPRIGEWLGRDHSTAIDGVRRADRLISTDPAFRCLIDRMISQFGGEA